MILPVVGQRFGSLTVVGAGLSRQETSGRQTPRTNIRCDCGQSDVVDTRELLRGHKIRCRICAYKACSKYHVGDRYDRLVVQGFEYVGTKRVATCCCDCGNTVKVLATLLGKNKTNNCGCRPRGLWQGVGDFSGTVYYRLKRGAQVRHIPFKVSPQQLWNLFVQQNKKCALTGLDIELSLESREAGTASVDRKNSRRGYFPDNIQWVHKDVNLMKSNFTQEYYVALCRSVAQHTKEVNQND